MRDQVDSDITMYLYSAIDFIEMALKDTDHKAKILVHCFKVHFQAFYFNIGQLSLCLCRNWVSYVEKTLVLHKCHGFGPRKERFH